MNVQRLINAGYSEITKIVEGSMKSPCRVFFNPESGKMLFNTGEGFTDSFVSTLRPQNFKSIIESFGVKSAELRGLSTKDIPFLSNVTDKIQKIKDYGVKLLDPDGVIILDWTDRAAWYKMCNDHNWSNPLYRPFYFGKCESHVVNGERKTHIILNTHNGDKSVFHEFGHFNHWAAQDSYWEAQGLKGYDFTKKQLEILGIDKKLYEIDSDSVSTAKGVFRGVSDMCVGSKFYLPIVNSAEKTDSLLFDTSKMISTMQKESKCYDSTSLGEQVAEIFQGLMEGKEYSDLTMLMYDFAGGARIPKLSIKGKPYDEYIASLYANEKLLSLLKQSINVVL